MIETIPVVILAGGEGRRIGGGKPQRHLAGKTLLQHAIAKAGSYSTAVAISLGKGAQWPNGDFAIIHDEGDVQGPIAGLIAALKFASSRGHDRVMIIPCDTPFLPDDLMQRLSEALGDTSVAVALSAEQLHSACSLWKVEVADLLPEYLAQGRRSLIGFAELAGYVAVEWPGPDEGRFMNINTAGDLLEAEQIFARMS